MVTVKQDWLITSKSRWEVVAPYNMNPTEITFHNTWNDASAYKEAKNVYNNSTGTSFHDAVDDIEVQRVIPYERNAWHAGDGNGRGNRHSIGVEICYSKSGGERYRKAELNAIDHISNLMIRFGIPISKVKTHQERNGKYCPHRMLDEGRVSWFKGELVKAVERKKNGLKESNSKEYAGKVEIDLGNVLQSGGTGWGASNEIAEALVLRGIKGRIEVQTDGLVYLVADNLNDLKLQELEYWVRFKGWSYSVNGTWKKPDGSLL